MATEAHGKHGIFTDKFRVFRMDSVAIYHDFDLSKRHSGQTTFSKNIMKQKKSCFVFMPIGNTNNPSEVR